MLARGEMARIFLFSNNAALSSICQDQTALQCIQQKEHRIAKSGGSKGVLIAIGVACLPFFVTDGWQILVMLIPLLLISTSFGPPTGELLIGIAKLSCSKVDVVCKAMQDHLEPDRQTPTQRLDATFWANLTEQYLTLDRDLEQIWSMEHCGAILLTDVALRGYFVVVFFVKAIACLDSGLQLSAWCIVGSAVSAIAILEKLYPLATITALCQSPSVGTQSVVRLTVRFCNCKMFDSDAKAEHARFLQAVTSTPVGVELPIFGLVTTQLLAGCAKFVVTAAPVAIAYILRVVGRSTAELA